VTDPTILAPVPRPDVMSIAAYVPGAHTLPGSNRVAKLSANEGPFGPPPGARAAYVAAADELHRYPDGGSAALRQAIGRRFGLDPERIVCGTGSDELIQHLAAIYGGPGTDMLMTMHGFAMYRIAGTYAGSRVLKVPERELRADVDALLAAVTPATTLLFLANPNNPTGSLLPRGEIERLRAGLPPRVLLVLDGAYAEYVTREDYDPGVALVDAAADTVMLRTFSKIFGLGGMRVGWCYAPAPVVDALNRVRGAFNVSLPAQAAAIAALEEPGWVERCRAHNTRWRAWLAEALGAAGIRVWPSAGNFVLAEFATPPDARAADAALRQSGVIVRGAASYDLPHCLRITVGTEEECTHVADVLARFMARRAVHA
jgi:histidinol-phosphate aminotransferase